MHAIIGTDTPASHAGRESTPRTRKTCSRWRRRIPRCALAAVALCLAGPACKRPAPDPETDASAPSAEPRSWFVEITDAAGLKFVHEAGDYGRWHMPEIMGGGAALFDSDHDGRLDAYLINGAFKWGGAAPGQPAPVNRLFRQTPDGRFVDATAESGLGDPHYGMGVAVGDIDNDGDADLLVTNEGPDQLYRNRGDGTFENITDAAGVDIPYWSASATFLDYNRDGFLDIYVTRYVHYNPTRRCSDGLGRWDYCGPKNFPYLSDVLLRNNTDGTFTDVSEEAGIAAVRAPGLGVVAEDLNDDGWVDVYVANDLEANQLWLNQRDGTFRDEAILRGVAFDLNGQAESGMGVLAADLDNDLRLDLYMTHLQGQTNTAYRNLGGGMGFADETGQLGLAAGCLTYTGFGTVALDAELDGDLDLLVANGKAFRGEPVQGVKLPEPWSYFAEPNLFYRNDGSGRFKPSEPYAAAFCQPIEISRGLAVGDIDADGDMDVLVANIEGPARLYRNDAPHQGHWLGVRARDPRLRRDAIGAKVTVRVGGRAQTRTVNGGFSYLAANEPVAHFGLAGASKVDEIEVSWPDGSVELFAGTPVDQTVRLQRGTGRQRRGTGLD